MGGKTKPPYPREFREEAIRLLRAGRHPEELGRELSVTGQTLRDWVKRADLDARIRTDGLASEEREELRQLRRRVHRLEQEEILKKSRGLLRPGDQLVNRPGMNRPGIRGDSEWLR